VAIGSQWLKVAADIIFLAWFLGAVGLTVAMSIMGYLSRKLLIAFAFAPVAAFALDASGVSTDLLATLGGIAILGLGSAGILLFIWRIVATRDKRREKPLGIAETLAFLVFFLVLVGVTVAAAVTPTHKENLPFSLATYYVLAACLASAYLIAFTLAESWRKRKLITTEGHPN